MTYLGSPQAVIRSVARCLIATGVLGLCVTASSAATIAPLSAHGQLLQLVRGPHGRVNASESSNWFGYNQGALESGESLFHTITATWTVPTASQHRRGQSEDSSDWIGIGGGCVNSGCAVSDSTLIQTGTEQDVSSSGTPSYDAWWEIIPGPSMSIHMTVRPGDRIRASITEILPASNVWRITIQDLARGTPHTIRTTYSSTQDTAEWIEETPLILGTNAGFAALPQLTSPRFDQAAVNGHPPAQHFQASI